MKLIFIYGPPASGKLTVAQELQKITNFKLYHNHLAYDLITSVFDVDKAKNFFKMTEKINLLLLSYAGKENISGVIYTYCFSDPDDNAFIKKIINVIKKHNKEIYFVQLVCDEFNLLKRVNIESRKKYKKINNKKLLQKVLQRYNFYKKIPFTESLSINNSEIPAKEVALKIKKYYIL